MLLDGTSPTLELIFFQDNSANGIVDLDCSVVDSSGVVFFGSPYTDCVFDDPLFCDPWDCSLTPSILGEYTVAMNSPALPENNSCGLLMGMFPMGCGDIVPTRKTTWGKLKTLYREPR